MELVLVRRAGLGLALLLASCGAAGACETPRSLPITDPVERQRQEQARRDEARARFFVPGIIVNGTILSVRIVRKPDIWDSRVIIRVRVSEAIKGALPGQVLTIDEDWPSCDAPERKVGDQDDFFATFKDGRLFTEVVYGWRGGDSDLWRPYQEGTGAMRARAESGHDAGAYDAWASFALDHGDPLLAVRALDAARRIDPRRRRSRERAEAARQMDSKGRVPGRTAAR